jgi:uncharacterized cupin superfamily protein
MERSDREEQEVLTSIKALLTHVGARAEDTPVCPRCGISMQYRDAKIWLYGTESEWNLRFPTCTCDVSAFAAPESGKTSKETAIASQFATNEPGWRQRYHAALFESDAGKILQRIAEAETAIILRARELFRSRGQPAAELRALDASLDALRALRCFTGIWRTAEKITDR